MLKSTGTSLRRHLLGILGPGLVTVAADDDPSGTATYSQTGAQFGYGQLWTAAWMLPLVIGVQEVCGRIGNVTGKRLARNIKEHYSPRVLRVLVVLLTIANTVNIGADIGAGAALVIPLPAAALMGVFTVLILALEIMVSYHAYARYLKWLTVALLACTARGSPPSTPRPTPPGPWSCWSVRSRTRGRSRRGCSRWASSRSACWPSRCSPGRPRTR
jgi:Mn2+/Fe2+ NRAMP family transporter